MTISIKLTKQGKREGGELREFFVLFLQAKTTCRTQWPHQCKSKWSKEPVLRQFSVAILHFLSLTLPRLEFPEEKIISHNMAVNHMKISHGIHCCEPNGMHKLSLIWYQIH